MLPKWVVKRKNQLTRRWKSEGRVSRWVDLWQRRLSSPMWTTRFELLACMPSAPESNT